MDKNNAPGSKGISRRSFLKGSVGVTALAVMGSGLTSYSVFAGTDSTETVNGTEYVNGFCDGCLYKKCRTTYKIENGVLISSDGHPEGIYNKGTLCVRGQAQVMNLYNPWRAKTPLKRTNPEKGLDVDPGWVEISWEEALDTTAKKIKEVMDKDPREFVMFSGFGAYHSLYMRAFTSAVGSPNVIFAPGCFCSAHSGSEILHGSFLENPDSKYCKYRIDIGRGGANAGSADG
ncbi:MAG: molybdopterin-dependent oxidoreductase, partial [Eubacteriales bacterium]